MKSFLVNLLLTIPIIGSIAGANTSESVPVYPKFNELRKLTVGPDDQLEATYYDNLILFTHKANMISHLRIQDLRTGEFKDLLPSDADSTQGKFNVSGQILFIYYKNNSRGDVCFTDRLQSLKELPLPESKITCLPREKAQTHAEFSQPFWIGNKKLGYIEKQEGRASLMTFDLDKKSTEAIISENSLMAPSSDQSGRLIVFNQLINNRSVITILDTQTKKQTSVTIPLPGSSGIATIDQEAKHIYFSHFMGDSNQDSLIDGHDNSVIWRTSLSDILKANNSTQPKGQDLAVEQLTPMDLNCSYPFAAKFALLVTCAFEGSLDIYQIPFDGFVPSSWADATLANAFQTARSYQDRILLLNQMKFRTHSEAIQKDIETRLFYLHLQADELTAASYYSERINIDPLIKIYLEGRIIKKAQPLKAKTFVFKEAIEKELRQLNSTPGDSNRKSLVAAHLNQYLGRSLKIPLLIKKVSGSSRPIDYWLLHTYAEEALSSENKNFEDWLKIYQLLIQGSGLNLESRLYYAFDFLTRIENSPTEKRNQLLGQMLKNLDDKNDIKVLIEAEIFGLELTSKVDPQDKIVSLQKIDKLLLKNKSNYFLRKAINVRAIVNFLNQQQFRELGIMAANWLRDTPNTSTEFSYARDVVISAAREQGYGQWSKGNPRLGSDYFFQALSLTDDLESYSGYFNTMAEIGQAKNRDERLEYLQKHNVMQDGIYLVKALLDLQANTDDKGPESALKDLDGLRADLIDPIPKLIKGYAYLELFQKTIQGVDYDRELWQKAHDSLILAADLARGRKRILSAALTNLGLLNLWGQNFRQSTRYFELRKQIGFELPQMKNELIGFTWYYAKALFLDGQSQRAAEELMALPSENLSFEVKERIAFYSAMSGHFDTAFKFYNEIQKTSGAQFEKLSEPSRSKIKFSYAYTLFELKKDELAKRTFEELLRTLPTKQKAESGKRSLDFNPDEIKAQIYGFLGQLGETQDKIKSLRLRLKLVENDLGSAMLTKLNLAEKLSPQNIKEASTLMQSATQDLRLYTAENGAIGQIVFRVLDNFLIHGLLYPEAYHQQKLDDIYPQVRKTLTILQRQQESAGIPILREHWKLQFLWGLFQEKVLGKPESPTWRADLEKSQLTSTLNERDREEFAQIKQRLGYL